MAERTRAGEASTELTNAMLAKIIQTAVAAAPNQGSLPNLLGDLAEGTTALGPTGEPVAARYRKGDENNPLGWTQERRGRLQRTLSEIGLLRGAFNSRLWGADSAQAYAAVLGTANRLGVDEDAALEIIRSDEQLRQEVVGGDRKVQPYLKPDAAAVTKDIKSIFARVLDRDVTTDELPDLMAEYSRLDRADYDQAVAASAPTATGAAVAQDLDPAARFEAFLGDRYRPELNMQLGSDEAAASRDALLVNIGSLSKAIGIRGPSDG